MFGNKEYKFIQEFSSPSLGNIYAGRKMHLPQKTGQKFVDAGLAEEVVAKKVAEPVKKVVVQNVGRSNSGASQSPSKGNAK